jgi:hypothetical protein
MKTDFDVWEKCYEMELGDKIVKLPNTAQAIRLVRVPGGWIYIFGDMEGTASVFVPFNNEFMTTKPKEK